MKYQDEKTFSELIHERRAELMGATFIMISFTAGSTFPKLTQYLKDGKFVRAALLTAGLAKGAQFLQLAMNGFVDSLLNSDRENWDGANSCSIHNESTEDSHE